MRGWNWGRGREERDWKRSLRRMRPFSAAVPWITLVFLMMMIWRLEGVLTSSDGALFALPETGVRDADDYSAVALIMPTSRGTVVFFDDTRFVLNDDAQMDTFSDRLSKRIVSSKGSSTLLVLADLRIRGGELMKFAEISKDAGAKRILFAEKKGSGVYE